MKVQIKVERDAFSQLHEVNALKDESQWASGSYMHILILPQGLSMPQPKIYLRLVVVVHCYAYKTIHTSFQCWYQAM